MEKIYAPSGEGFWYDRSDPSRGFYGISREVEKMIDKQREEESLLEEYLAKSRSIKVEKFLSENLGDGIGSKINFLKKLNYNGLYVKKELIDGGVSVGRKIALNNLSEEHYPNLIRFYERVVNELREILNNPYKKSTLVDRLDSVQ
jgi:hypothetical protein